MNQKHTLQLKTHISDVIIITGMGMTMQSAQKFDVPMDMDWLVNRLFSVSKLVKKDNENRNESLDRFLATFKPYKQRDFLKQILDTELPIQNFTAWNRIIKIGRPIITQSLDLHAAISMYHHINGFLPKNLSDLDHVILTWESNLDDLKLFFQGKTKKILYREGCILHQNYLLGKKNYNSGSQSDGMKFIDKIIKQSPVLLIGTLAAVRTSPIRAKLREIEQKSNNEQSDIFRIVKKGTKQILFVNDILCDDYQEDFAIVLSEMCESLIG